MKFKIERSKFLDALKTVQNIVAGKGSLAILQNVLIEARGKEITLITTDLDISIKTVCECTVEELGSTTLPVKFLFNAVAKVNEGIVEIEVDAKERATIISGNAKFRLVGMPVSEFPKLPKTEESYAYKIGQDIFKEMLKKVSYAASQDDTRRALKGVLMSFKNSKVTMVATDGRRLALVEKEIEISKDAEKDIVLPLKAVSELQRSLSGNGEITISMQSSQICFMYENITIYSKLIEESYPNFKQVIPEDTVEHIVVDRQMFLDAIDRVSIMTIDEAHSIKLVFSNGKLTVNSAASDIGEAKDELPIKYAGEKIEIMFNPTYVMDPLRVIEDNEVTININDGHSPAVIKCSMTFLYVLMPLRIS